LSTIEDDFYVFDAARNHLVGRRTRRIIRLGDKVTVQVAKVDSAKKQVDFRLAMKKGTANKPAFETLKTMPQQRQLLRVNSGFKDDPNRGSNSSSGKKPKAAQGPRRKDDFQKKFGGRNRRA
jgi:ribonuclease R